MSGNNKIIYSLLLLFALFMFCPSNLMADDLSDSVPDYDSKLLEDVEDKEVASDEDSQTSDVRLEINVAARKLYLFEDDELVRSFSIAVGTSEHRTPTGRRYMQQIVWNPWWIPPKSDWAKSDKKTPPGPGNPLGPVKMDLGKAILIHGTSQPRSIGRAASHGCMRMLSSQAKELARWIQETIVKDNDPGVFSKYNINSKRSYYINLPQHIPVDISYDVVKVRDDTLYIYQDIYARAGGKKMKLIQKTLKDAGYDPDEYKLDFIEKQIRTIAKADFSFDLNKMKFNDKEIKKIKKAKKKEEKKRKKYALLKQD